MTMIIRYLYNTP